MLSKLSFELFTCKKSEKWTASICTIDFTDLKIWCPLRNKIQKHFFLVYSNNVFLPFAASMWMYADLCLKKTSCCFRSCCVLASSKGGTYDIYAVHDWEASSTCNQREEKLSKWSLKKGLFKNIKLFGLRKILSNCIYLSCKEPNRMPTSGRGVLFSVWKGNYLKSRECTWSDFDRGRAIEASKPYPFLIPIFWKSIPDLVPIFWKVYPTLYFIPQSWKTVPFRMPNCENWYRSLYEYLENRYPCRWHVPVSEIYVVHPRAWKYSIVVVTMLSTWYSKKLYG